MTKHYVAIYEVTQASYEKIINKNPAHFAFTGAGREAVAGIDTDLLPVERISWIQAAEFCTALARVENQKPMYDIAGQAVTELAAGEGYRLLTEAEWEFACRAGTTTRFWDGDEPQVLNELSWSNANAGGRTHAVGKLKGNPFGLFDVLGNVFEWVQDRWDANCYERFRDTLAVDPRNHDPKNTLRVMRGGSWLHGAPFSRSAYRQWGDPLAPHDSVGFRVALPVDAVRQALKVQGPAIPKVKPATQTNPAQEPIDYAAERKAAEALIAFRKAKSVPIDIMVRLARNGAVLFVTDEPGAFFDEPFTVHTVNDSSGKLTNDDMGLVAACPNLEVLHLHNGSPVTDEGLRRLKPLHRLTSLGFGYPGVLGEEVASLIESNPDLAVVTLDGTAASPKSLAAALGRCPRLRKLNIAATAVSPDLYATLGKHCRDLRLLHVGEPHGVDLPALASLPRLSDLSITGEHLKPKRVEASIKALASMRSLETLRFEPPNSNEGLQQLVPLAKKLRSLTVMGWYDWNPGVTSEGWKTLEEFTALETLWIGGYTSSLDGPTLLSLAKLPALRELILSFDEKGQFYTAADLAEFRRLRPDVTLKGALGKEWKTFPALENYPRGRDGRSLAEWDLPKDAPAPAVVPFTPDEAKAHQEAWSKFTKQPVEVENSIGMKFRLIPAGQHSVDPNLGSGPQIHYRLTQPYYLGATEVTVAQFRSFLNETGHKPTGTLPGGQTRQQPPDGGGGPQIAGHGFWESLPYPVRDDDPATLVSQADAGAFCDWLSKREGTVYRLPTEGEWFFACAAGGERRFGFAETLAELREHEWDRSSVKFPVSKESSPLHRVGTLKANPFGLFDMLGNVHEWSRDRLTADQLADMSFVNPFGQPLPYASWLGGSWVWEAGGAPYFSPANRGTDGSATVSTGYDYIGFRVLKELPGAKPLPKPFEQPVTVNPGRPLSSQAIVSRPAAIPGLRSWTIEPAMHNGSGLAALAWSPRGDVIATAYGHDSSVRLWDREGNLKRVLLGHDEDVVSLSFSHDGTLLASGERRTTIGGGEGRVRVWDVATGRTRVLIQRPEWIHSVAFSPVDRTLAFNGPFALPLMLVDLDSGRFRAFSGPRVERIAWSPDGRALVTVGGLEAAVWRPDATAAPTKLETPDSNEGLTSVAWSPDGKWIAAGNGPNLRIWDAKTAGLERTIGSDYSHILATAWSRDSQRLLVAGEGGPAWAIFDARRGTRLLECKAINSYGAVWSPNESEVAVWDHNAGGPVVICDAENGKVLRRSAFRGSVRGWLDSPTTDGRTIYGSRAGGGILAFDAATGQYLRELPDSRASGTPYVLASPSGRLVLWWWSSVLSIAESETGRPVRQLRIEPSKPEDFFSSVVWSPDDRFVATAGGDRKIRIWNVSDGQVVRELIGHESAVWNLAWSPDGALVASVGADKTVRLWKAATGELVATYREFPEALTARGPDFPVYQRLTWTADSRALWIALLNHAVRLDVATGRLGSLAHLSQGNTILSLALTSNEDRLIGREGYGWTVLHDFSDNRRQVVGRSLGWDPHWLPDSRRIFGFESITRRGIGYDTRTNQRLGTLIPSIGGDGGFHDWLCVGPTGHYRGSAKVDEHIVYVAIHDDGSQVTYTPAEFREKFGWKNDPEKATLLELPVNASPSAEAGTRKNTSNPSSR